MRVLIDLTGKKFGRYSVLYRDITSKNTKFICKCDCGTIRSVSTQALLKGRTKSCGCFSAELASIRNSTHGASKYGKISSEYHSWAGIKRRCYDKNNPAYKNYGGRGIKVCHRWLESFENFFDDMGKKPTPNHSLDRFPDKNGNYEKSNCRWATDKEQANNTRKNIWFEYNGERNTMSGWSEKLNISQDILWARKKSGWDVKDILTKPIRFRTKK